MLSANPNPVFQVSGATYRMVTSFYKPEWYPKCAPTAQRSRPLILDLGSPTVHWIDKRHYMADGRWRRLTLNRSLRKLNTLQRERSSDTCIVVGNGPSLRHTDLSLLEGHDVFISNYAVIDEGLKSKAKYLGMVNPHVAEQDPELFNNLRGLVKFFPYWLRYCLEEAEDVIFLNELPGQPFFSTDVSENVSGHSTVTHFNLQIAYSLGYRKAVLVGCDNAYQQPSEAREGDILKCDTDDPNHFRPDYFRGKRWQAADTQLMSLVYLLAKQAYEKDGREIVNCTTGGALEAFRRGDLAQELSGPSAKRSATASITAPPQVEVSSTRASSLDFLKGRHHGTTCRIFFDAPPLPECSRLNEVDVISVDQQDLGIETPCLLPRYLLMTNKALVRTFMPDLRLLGCTKLIVQSAAAEDTREDALTHLIDPSLLPDVSGCFAPSPDTPPHKHAIALAAAVHLGYSKILFPLATSNIFRPAADPSAVEILSNHGVELGFF